MSNVKKMTKEEVVEKKIEEHKSSQYELLKVLMAHEGTGNLGRLELYSKVTPIAKKIYELQNELGGKVQQLTEKTPGIYADGHGNSARMHIRAEGEKLVLTTMVNKELGEGKYPIIKIALDGSVEITENMELVREIFENPHIKDIREISLGSVGEIPEVSKEDLRNFYNIER
ncbi:MAG TPA: hypothetical protein VNF06_03575 [Candidatus Aquilonibacter sp.]|nr:hypothetical protein [Candidatus Aquilonibacter sp.]